MKVEENHFQRKKIEFSLLSLHDEAVEPVRVTGHNNFLSKSTTFVSEGKNSEGQERIATKEW